MRWRRSCAKPAKTPSASNALRTRCPCGVWMMYARPGNSIWSTSRLTAMQRDKPRGLTRLLRAWGASVKGLAGAYREEAAFRQELLLAVIALPLGTWLGRSGVER